MHKATTKKELAQLYFPDAPSPKAATDRLMAWIYRCPELCRALARAHYTKHSKTLSPRHVALITEYLGDP